MMPRFFIKLRTLSEKKYLNIIGLAFYRNCNKVMPRKVFSNKHMVPNAKPKSSKSIKNMSLCMPDHFLSKQRRKQTINVSIGRCLECSSATALASYIGFTIHTTSRSIGKAQDKE